MSGRNLFRIGIVVLIMALAAGISITYVLQGAYHTGLVHSGSNVTAASVQAGLEASFLKDHGISGYTSVYTAYGMPIENTIIVNCRYGIYPQGLTPLPLVSENVSDSQNMIDQATKDEFLVTLCGLYDYPGCQEAIHNLSSIIINHTAYNSTAIERIFNSTKDEVKLYYSLYENGSFPLFSSTLNRDLTVLNSSADSVYSMLESVLNVTGLPQYVIPAQNGTVATSTVFFTPPFQLQTAIFPEINSCGTPLDIFNLVSNSTEFGQPYYSAMTYGLPANITNICINSSANECDQSVMKKLGFSFYVQQS
ncbi:hypothetical protein M1293_00585 [Candidatus Parvarchaeota archaeon]|nr:hypothetical protein [Candidatus Parvarchaeota archaeon]